MESLVYTNKPLYTLPNFRVLSIHYTYIDFIPILYKSCIPLQSSVLLFYWKGKMVAIGNLVLYLYRLYVLGWSLGLIDVN